MSVTELKKSLQHIGHHLGGKLKTNSVIKPLSNCKVQHFNYDNYLESKPLLHHKNIQYQKK